MDLTHSTKQEINISIIEKNKTKKRANFISKLIYVLEKIKAITVDDTPR